MIHIHKKQCESTQSLALELSKTHKEDILVTCDTQLAGEGQRGRKWVHADQAIALSFSTWPSDVYTLSSLEVACLTREHLLQQYNVQTMLKWPNDIYTMDGKKCGGILIQNSDKQLIVGIGINFSANNIPDDLKDKMGALYSSKVELDS
ncbi:MAG: biotin--[acetyl-CoA-carboxylase] ligase, partial [Bacteriovoracaceae bacterium]|nr:biotin--[acetyl-CoA-carboxylase] ligase [Bacteriovoracaceae bacterium]